MAGFVAVGAVISATAVAARHDADTSAAAAVGTVTETAWLPDGTSDVLLADAGHIQPLASVSIPLPISGTSEIISPRSVTQAGRSAIVTGGGQAQVLDGRAWRPAGLPVRVSPDTFVVAGPAAAWLVAPGAGTARHVDLDATPGAVTEPMPVDPGLTPQRARVTDDGTLWLLGRDGLRGLSTGRPPIVVPLDGSNRDRALTLLDGDPVVIDAHGARAVDPATGAIRREWPLDLPDGPITAAERSTGVVVARTHTRLAVTGRNQAPVSIPLRSVSADAVPVVQEGLVHLARSTTNEIAVFDPRAGTNGREVRRVSVPGTGHISVFGHHQRVWYTRHDKSTVSSGVVTASSTARPISLRSVSSETPVATGARDTNGSSGDGLPAETAEPSTKADGPRPPRAPGLDSGDRPCPRSWPGIRCQPDADDIRPGAVSPAGPSAPGCPQPWSVAGCTIGLDGPDANTGSGDPAGPDSLDPGPDPPPVPRRPAPPVEPGAPVLPDVIGLSGADAVKALKAAGVDVSSLRPVPALRDTGTVETVRHQGQPLAAGAPVLPGLHVDLDVGDGSKPVLHVAVNSGHLCIVTTDGAVACQGSNFSGQLGDGTTNPSLTPVRVRDLPPAFAVGVGYYHACALLQDRTVRCWGDNMAGQLGSGTTDPSLVPVAVVGLTDVEELAVARAGACARRADLTVWCWGNKAVGAGGEILSVAARPLQVPGVAPARSIGGTTDHSCAVQMDTTVRCWGTQGVGEMGNGPQHSGDFFALSHPVTVRDREAQQELRGMTQVATTGYGTCSLRYDQTVTCWGRMIGGRYPSDFDPSWTWDRPTTLPGVDRALTIASGYRHTCALITGGTVRCWGENLNHPELMDNYGVPPETVPGITSAIAISAGSASNCAILTDRSLHCWGIIPLQDTPRSLRTPPIRIRVER